MKSSRFAEEQINWCAEGKRSGPPSGEGALERVKNGEFVRVCTRRIQNL